MKPRTSFSLNSYNLTRLRKMARLCEGHRILDIGYAQLPNPYLKNFYSVGFDLEKPRVKTDFYDEEVHGDVKNIVSILHGEKFDTILCGELIEHLENPYSFLRNLQALLNDEGLLILSTPNPFGFPAFVCEMLHLKKFFYTTDHTYLFPPRWVRRIVENCNYRLVQTQSVGLWLLHFTCPICPKILSWQVIYVAKKTNN